MFDIRKKISALHFCAAMFVCLVGLWICGAIDVKADEYQGTNYKLIYTITGGHVKITDLIISGSNVDVIIPLKIVGNDVTEMDGSACCNKSGVKSFVFEGDSTNKRPSLTITGSSAFYNCSDLTNVEFGDIERDLKIECVNNSDICNVFRGYNSTDKKISVAFGDVGGDLKISSNSSSNSSSISLFYNCGNITFGDVAGNLSLSSSSSNSSFSSTTALFYNCGDITFGDVGGDLSISSTSTTAYSYSSSYLFRECNSLTELDFSKVKGNLTVKGTHSLCPNLSLIKLPTTDPGSGRLITIEGAFNHCGNNASEMQLIGTGCKANTIDIKYGAFKYCKNLSLVDFSGSTANININSGSFQDSFKIGAKVDFSNCTGNLTFEHGVFSYENKTGSPHNTESGFASYHPGLSELDFANCTGAILFKSGAFQNLYSLTDINFSGCSNLSFTEGAFAGCKNLMTVDFSNCASLNFDSGAFQNSFAANANTPDFTNSNINAINGGAFGYCDWTGSYKLPSPYNQTLYTIQNQHAVNDITDYVPPYSILASPENLNAVAGNGKIDLSWTAPTPNQLREYFLSLGLIADITDYEYSIDNGISWASTGSIATSYQITGLTNGQEYSIQLRAVSSGISGAIAQVNDITLRKPSSSSSDPEEQARQTEEYVEHILGSGSSSSSNGESKPSATPNPSPETQTPSPTPSSIQTEQKFCTLAEIKLPDYVKRRPFISIGSDRKIRPDEDLTRAEACQMLYRLTCDGTQIDLDLLEKFSDVDKNFWGANAIAYITSKNIIHADNNLFRPNGKITRAEFSQVVFKALTGFLDQDIILKLGNYYVELTDIANNFAYEEINQLASNNFVNGYKDKTFRPDKNITRAEAIVMISKSFRRIIK